MHTPKPTDNIASDILIFYLLTVLFQANLLYTLPLIQHVFKMLIEWPRKEGANAVEPTGRQLDRNTVLYAVRFLWRISYI
jgi:hypothetical protein